MWIGVPKELAAGEKRVATVPDVVEKLVKLGFSVAVESGAGDAANFADDTYRAAGAQVLPTAADVWGAADIVFKVRPPTADEAPCTMRCTPSEMAVLSLSAAPVGPPWLSYSTSCTGWPFHPPWALMRSTA